jgi:hypothetical protein
VGELLDVPLYEIARARGAGALVRKELNRRHKQWTAALRRAVEPAAPSHGRAGAKTPRGPVPEPTAAVELEVRADWVPSIEELAVLLSPSKSRRRSSKTDTIRLLLGLPDEQGIPAPWPTQVEVGRQLGIAQMSVSRNQKAAVSEWAGQPWMTAVRDELVELVAASGRVTTARDLAAALRARRGASDDVPARTIARALAVVRAAVETEVRSAPVAGADATPRSSTDDPQAGDALGVVGGGDPRLAVVRRGDAILIAVESLPGTDDPSPQELADYAMALGRVADDLAARDPLPGRGTVLRDLRAVTPPVGFDPLADTRLVELAAAVSTTRVAASPRLELYPRGLDLARALRISQAASGVRQGTSDRRESGITVDALLARVRARFPDILLDDPPTHVQLGEALAAAGYLLEYDAADRRFRPPVPPTPTPSSTSTSLASVHSRAGEAAGQPTDVATMKLDAALTRGGFLALTLRGRHLPGTAAAIAQRYPIAAADLNLEFLAVFRTLVAERGQDWAKVLGGDARLSQTRATPRGLSSYLRTAMNRLGERLPAMTGERQVLFVHDAGLLARYWDDGGRELLTGLQNAARRSAGTPFGLWLLCPGEHAREVPRLDGKTVEVLGDHERVVLDTSAIRWLHGMGTLPGQGRAAG